MGELLPNRGLDISSYWGRTDGMRKLWDDELQDQIIESLSLETRFPTTEYIKLKVNGVEYQVWDDGQDCCEHRYITTDDDLPSYVGAMLIGLIETEGETTEDYNGCDDVHERQFLRLYTSRGVCVFETHNEHNGYYGGFSVQLRRV